jgi:transcriptional regulator with XRE-family HTH domain
MTNHEFKRALTKLGWTQQRAAQELDLSSRTITRYVCKEAEIPRSVELAILSLLFTKTPR